MKLIFWKWQLWTMLVTPNLLPYFATMELAFKRDVPYFIFFFVLFFLLSFWREKATLYCFTGLYLWNWNWMVSMPSGKKEMRCCSNCIVSLHHWLMHSLCRCYGLFWCLPLLVIRFTKGSTNDISRMCCEFLKVTESHCIEVSNVGLTETSDSCMFLLICDSELQSFYLESYFLFNKLGACCSIARLCKYMIWVEMWITIWR